MPSPPTKTRNTGTQPPRKSRRKYDFDVDTLRAYSYYRQNDAAKMLGVSAITLKRICQRRKYRWPYRTIKAQANRAAREARKRQSLRKTSVSGEMLSEVLLTLHLGDRKAMNGSPTSVSYVSLPSFACELYPKPVMRSPKTKFPHVNTPVTPRPPPQLPPLTFLLRKLDSKVPPLCLSQPSYRETCNYKSSCYAASFAKTAPTFPRCGISTTA